MARGIDWRSPDFAKSFDRLDRADFSQEFLRRNKSYRTDYAEAAAIAATHNQQAGLAKVAEQWGLVFRL